ncbi:hypothetical protein F5X99DRAFT_268601 [Biscogniauxia marginata]|nr:hypothetical protein F5X99DRAFT_268601 [Biscogniauxia marginata]
MSRNEQSLGPSFHMPFIVSSFFLFFSRGLFVFRGSTRRLEVNLGGVQGKDIFLVYDLTIICFLFIRQLGYRHSWDRIRAIFFPTPRGKERNLNGLVDTGLTSIYLYISIYMCVMREMVWLSRKWVWIMQDTRY